MRIEEPELFLSVAWKWYGQSTVHCKTLADFPLYKKDPYNDRELSKYLHDIMNQADIICAYNGDSFDIKVANTFFIKHDLPPLRPQQSVDPLKWARGHFKFPNNKLDTIAKILGHEGKTLSHGDLWYDCYQGDMKAWRKMVKYNKVDVEILEFVYEKLRPYAKNHPNFNLYEDRECCPACASTNFKPKEYRYTATGMYQGYQCECGKRFHGRKNLADKIEMR